MAEQEQYRRLCDGEPSIPLFAQAWWLDATCGENGWGVALVHEKGSVQAALPYQLRHRGGITLLGQPPLTQFLGPWLRPFDKKEAVRLARQKDLMLALIEALPKFGRYAQNWSPSITNWLPFYWRGFHQTTRYTYVIDTLNDHDALWSNLQVNARTDIRKASNRYNVRLRDDPTLEDFLALTALTFARQGKAVPYRQEYVAKLDLACASRACRKIFIAEDDTGRAHAGAYIAWDAGCAHYLIGGGDPELRTSGATSFCLWEAVKFASTVSSRFDFEGSMVEPIERFFRSFGARQAPYFQVTKERSRLLHLREALRLAGQALLP